MTPWDASHRRAGSSGGPTLEEAQEQYLIVGGVAFAYSTDPNPNVIEIIAHFPGSSGEDQKTPTELSYDHPGKWGTSIRPEMARYGWFKLHLDREAGERVYNDPNLFSRGGSNSNSTGGGMIDHTMYGLAPGKTAVQMATDYLALLYEHVMRRLAHRCPSVDGMRIRFYVTTPAIWSPRAQEDTRLAAERAGFGSRPGDEVFLVSEPEAAANYALKKLCRQWAGVIGRGGGGSGGLGGAVVVARGLEMARGAGWEVGSQVMVVDAGGGTVDIVVYEIVQVQDAEGEPCLRVAETIRPQGGLCGATAVERAFHSLLAGRLGEQQRGLLTREHLSRGSRLMQSFDYWKKSFGSGEMDDVFPVEHNIRGLRPIPEQGVYDDKVVLTHADMEALFEPTIKRVTELIDDVARQARAGALGKPLKGMVLVGGFGRSWCLQAAVREWCEAQDPPIYLDTPQDGWAAIAKGAVSHGLEGLHLTQRKLPCHYGVHMDRLWDAQQGDDPKYRYLDEVDGMQWNNDSITWFAKMNMTVDRDTRIEVPFFFQTHTLGGSMVVTLTCSKYSKPPGNRKSHQAVTLPPLTIDLSKLPSVSFQRHTVGGGGLFGLFSKSVYRANFKLEMVVESASVRFEIWHGKELAARLRPGAVRNANSYRVPTTVGN